MHTHPRFMLAPICGLALVASLAGHHASAAEVDVAIAQSLPRVPAGYTVELVAGSPLVEHPMMACFDERGRLFIAESAGKNLQRADLEKQLPNFIRMIEDTDGDGKFDKSTIFADKLTFPQGVLCHEGSVYCSSSGAVWKFTDTDGDGVADERVKLVGDFGYTGNAADLKGPFLGPDGRLYILEGRHGHEVRDKDGKLISKGKAGRIFSCKIDGSDFRSYCGGGFDNPVEIIFTDEGDMLGTVNLMYHQPRGDCLVHWVYGGVYPRTDFIDQLKGEFHFTGDLLPEVHNFGHVALSGLCRYRSEHFGLNAPSPTRKGAGQPAPKHDGVVDAKPRAEDAPQSSQTGGPTPFRAGLEQSPLHLFITQFNTHKVVHTTLERSGSTYKLKANEDFLTSDSIDFHPTDVLEDADGSLLVIDTGGWFRIGCPVSQVEKPDVKGAIWRVRKTGGRKYEDARGLKIDWKSIDLGRAIVLLSDERFAVRERVDRWLALTSMPHVLPRAERLLPVLGEIVRGRDLFARRLAFNAIRDLTLEESDNSPTNDAPTPGLVPGLAGEARITGHAYPPGLKLLMVGLALPNNDRLVEHAIIHALIEIGDAQATAKGLSSDNERVRKGAAIALEQMRRKLTLTDAKQEGIEVPPPHVGVKLTKEETAKLLAAEKDLPVGEAASGKKVFESQKASCAICHKIGEQGAEVSLNLSKIGAIRGRRDLLESILYPNASFARGFEPFVITLKDGQIVTGLISSETAQAIHVKNANNQETKVARDTIEKIEAGRSSIMPGNYGELLSTQELADLVAYLQSLK